MRSELLYGAFIKGVNSHLNTTLKLQSCFSNNHMKVRPSGSCKFKGLIRTWW
jgi:hypothetical protein